MKLLRLTCLFTILFYLTLYSQNYSSSKAKGIFLGFGAGFRLPLFEFLDNTDVGYGFNLEVSFSDTDILPIFLFSSLGFEQFPGSQNFFQESDYSNFHTNMLSLNVGLRNYFSPIAENIFLFMPFIQAGINYAYFQKLHEFKIDRGKNNFLEENSKLGVFVGGGFSMFLMELQGNYYFLKSNSYIGIDFKVRIPIFVSL
jgi:hypothetical protein